MKILSVDKDKVQVELTREEINKIVDMYLINGSTMIIEVALPDCPEGKNLKIWKDKDIDSLSKIFNLEDAPKD